MYGLLPHNALVAFTEQRETVALKALAFQQMRIPEEGRVQYPCTSSNVARVGLVGDLAVRRRARDAPVVFGCLLVDSAMIFL